MATPRFTLIEQRQIGESGLTTGVLSLGSWHTYDRIDFADTVALIRLAADAGISLFDVGVYGFPGQPPVFTDVIFSAAVRAAGLAREDYLFSSKLWLEGYPEHSLRSQLERALSRAGIQHADLAILGDLHGRDVDLDQLVLDLAELMQAGLIRSWGVNNWSASTIQTLLDRAAEHRVAGPAMAQLKYSVARRSIPDGAPLAKIFAQGVTLQSSDVLEGGLLLGKAGREVGRDPGGVRDRIIESAGLLSRIAADLGSTPAAVCIAFTLTHPANTTTLFGATSLEQLGENLAAIDLVEQVGASQLRELVAPLWADRDAVDPEGP
ncbi:MAG: aldo/keto reductase [Actinomycetota bacterium]|nr:aldo/keto reductase [Actinomycetota bacterium]MDQ2955760.1 aldo/keto reductase [Actinomycetota bacterium]